MMDMVKKQMIGVAEFTGDLFSSACLLGSAVTSFAIGVMILIVIVLPAGLFSLACFAMAFDALFGTNLLGLFS